MDALATRVPTSFLRALWTIAYASSWRSLQVTPPLPAGDRQSGDRQYGPGTSDAEIKIGQTMPHSGPLSASSVIGKVQPAYFRMINDHGGVNGRKITLISYDDAATPSKTVEQVRRLIESDEVLFTFQTLGNASNIAVQKYLNDRKIPQLLVAGRATRFEDPINFPWTMGFAPNLRTEIRVYARFILGNYPNARIGLLYQNDESGRDYLTGLKEALGARAGELIVSDASGQFGRLPIRDLQGSADARDRRRRT